MRPRVSVVESVCLPLMGADASEQYDLEAVEVRFLVDGVTTKYLDYETYASIRERQAKVFSQNGIARINSEVRQELRRLGKNDVFPPPELMSPQKKEFTVTAVSLSEGEID